MEGRGQKFAVDWECHENKIITFHDLNEDIPLALLIDIGTITPLSPDEFFSANEGYELVFKSLLRRCLQQMLYHRNVVWQNTERLFIFCNNQDSIGLREETWIGGKENSRTVFGTTWKKENPPEAFYHKHFAFAVQFKRIENKWYLTIIPEWFFSYDKYHKSRFCEDKVSYLKRKEHNIQIYNHLRFIVFFLSHDNQPSLFSPYRNRAKKFLEFGEIVTFGNHYALPDIEWLPPSKEKDAEDEKLLGVQLPLDFDL